MANEKVKKPAGTPPKAAVILGKGGVTEAGWHAVGDAFRCMKAYQLGKVRGISQPQVQTPLPLAIGTLLHAGRARWFARRFRTDDEVWREMQQAMQDAAVNERLPISREAELTALSLIQQYVEHWKMRPLPDPKAAEYKLMASLAPEGTHAPWAARTARLDDASIYEEAGGKLAIGEAKTTSADIDAVVREYELHGQPLLQQLLWKLDPRGEARFGPAAGFVLDVTVKPESKGGKAKFGRVFIPVNQRALLWYQANMIHKLQQVQQVTWDSEVPRSPAGCTFMAGRARIDCAFKPLCSHGRAATGGYVLPGGQSLLNKEHWKGETPPWE